MLVYRPNWWADWVDKYMPKRRLDLDPDLQFLHLKCRDLACNYVEEKIKSYFHLKRVKYISVKFEEHSDASPCIKIQLPYKGDIQDNFYVTFNRNNYYEHVQLWIPTSYEYHTYYSGAHKKNYEIIKGLQEYLPVERIMEIVNFPFLCQNKSIT